MNHSGNPFGGIGTALKRRYGSATGSLKPGDRVRVTVEDEPRRGTVESVEGDQLKVRLDPVGAVAPPDEVEEVEEVERVEPVVSVPMGHARKLIKRRRST